MVLALRRGLPSYADMLNLDPVAGWRWDTAPLIHRLAGQAFGIVGFGRIGRAVAARARAFGCRVLYYDPHLEEAPDGPPGQRVESLDALLDEADVVSLHCPLTAETRGLIGAAQLARMKPGALLVNTARGPLVDIDALAAALRAGRPGGAFWTFAARTLYIFDLLTFTQRIGIAFYVVCMNEKIFAAFIRRNESKAFLHIEKFDSACLFCHWLFPP